MTATDVAATNPLQSVLTNFIASINDPTVTVNAGGSFTRIVVTAKSGSFTGGNGIPISATTGTTTNGDVNCTTTSTTATELMTVYNSTGNDASCHPTVNTCCAVVPQSPIFPGNPAVPGELISIRVAGMGDIQNPAGNDITNSITTGFPYDQNCQAQNPPTCHPFPGPTVTNFNDVLSANFAAATIGGTSAQVISAGLEDGSYGIYRVDVQVPISATNNSQTPLYIAQNAFISNTVYLPIGNAVSSPPTPPPPVPASPINISIDDPHTAAVDSATSVTGTVTVDGWAIDASSPITNVAVQVDGSTVANLTTANGGYGRSRPDVCVAYPSVYSCPNVGYSYQLDTTAFANGGHTLQILATDSAGRNHTNPQGVAIFVNNDPTVSETHVTIDTPTTLGQLYHGVVLFSGWATNDHYAIVPSSFKASIDGAPIPASQITYGIARPDVCAVSPLTTPNCPNVGWTYLADLTKLANSTQPDGTTITHTFTITAVAADGVLYTVSSVFYVNNYDPVDLFSGPAITIDAPGVNTVLSGTAQLFGWAIDSYTTINNVEYSIDGVPLGTIFYGLGRPDVCAAYAGLPNFDLSTCPYVGFTGSFDTTLIADGPHTLGITATPMQGQPYTLTRPINVANLSTTANPVRITIDSPAEISASVTTLTGVASVSGWTLTNSPSTETVASVTVSVDGLQVGTVTPNDPRPDVCATYTGRPGCPNVGYHYALDTTHLTNGAHVIEITSATASGKRATASASFNVSNTSASAKTVIETPNAGSLPISGIATASGWALKTGVRVNTVTYTVDGVPYGSANVNISRTDVCATYPSSPNCPYVGWSFYFDTDALLDGTHILGVTANAADGTVSTANTTFTVQNWSAGAPVDSCY